MKFSTDSIQPHFRRQWRNALWAGLACMPLLAGAQALDTRRVADGLNSPLFATAPLNDGRLFVVEKGGTIKVVQGATTNNFLSVPVSVSGEEGLLGLAFDPQYGVANTPGARRFFVNYIEPGTGDTVVASYLTMAGNASLADPNSRQEVIRFDQPDGRTNHKAGWLGFRPGDGGHLYIATGDGGSGNDPDNYGQRRNELLGSILRIDVYNDDPALAGNYRVPANNPFVGQGDDVRGEIFAYGLRNPFRNSFDRTNGNFWIADVGQGAREEVNFIGGAGAGSGGGQNFGWRFREGDIATPGVPPPDPPPAPAPTFTEPILAYNISSSQSITGGYVVRDPSSPLFGKYVFADFITGRIFAIDGNGNPQTLASATELTNVLDNGQGGALGNISSFGEGASGELYIVDYGTNVAGSGKVVAVVPEPAPVLLMLLGGGAVAWVTRRRRLPSAL